LKQKGGFDDQYLPIASRDPFESNDVSHCYDLARGLAQAGTHVRLFRVSARSSRKCRIKREGPADGSRPDRCAV